MVNLTDRNLEGARRDLAGNPVMINGRFHNHLDEVRNAIQGLQHLIARIHARLANGDISEGERGGLERLVREAELDLQRVSAALRESNQ